MTRQEAVQRFEELVSECGRSQGDEEFLETLEEFEDRARTAWEARRDELKKFMITKRWNEHGFWQYSCGCVQYQDGSDRCWEHRDLLPVDVVQLPEQTPPVTLIAQVHALPGAYVPQHQTPGSVGLDVSAAGGCRIPSGATALVELNIVIKPPDGYFFMMVARSSLFKKGLTLVNGVGIIDPDFCGADDRVRVPLYNFGDRQAMIVQGDRIAQLVLLPAVRVVFEETAVIGPSRGGFGSTGA